MTKDQSRQKRIFLSGLADEMEAALRFRLVYEGPVRPTQGPDPMVPKPTSGIADHKQQIRKVFHGQLRELWKTNPTLRNLKYCASCGFNHSPIATHFEIELGGHELLPVHDWIQAQHNQFGYQFLPLVRDDFQVYVDLDILFVRRDQPGSALNSGDIDNRVKTIIDTLTMPANKAQLGTFVTPDADENPFYCLMANDKMVSRFSVETDTYLKPNDPTKSDDGQMSLVVVDVGIKPYNPTFFNLSFA